MKKIGFKQITIYAIAHDLGMPVNSHRRNIAQELANKFNLDMGVSYRIFLTSFLTCKHFAKYKQKCSLNYRNYKEQKNSTEINIKNDYKEYKKKSEEFLSSYAWRKLRMEALIKYGAVCQCCGESPKTGAVMNVDHIKPRKDFPELSLKIENLQILCNECNHGKGNWNTKDWRK